MKEIFRLEAVRQLAWVEGIVFEEEMSDREKIETLMDWFQENRG